MDNSLSFLGRLHLIKGSSLILLLLLTIHNIQTSALAISAKAHQDLDKTCYCCFVWFCPQGRQGGKVPTEQNKIKSRSFFSVSVACATVYNVCSLLHKGNERMNLYDWWNKDIKVLLAPADIYTSRIITI